MLFLQLKPTDIDIPADSVIINRITENTQKFIELSWSDKLTTITNGAINVGLKLVAAIIVLFIGKWLIKRVDKLINKMFIRRDVDSSINTFVRNMVRIVSWLLLLLIVISILGIKTTSIVAILASAGFAVGMALSGTLQNFAGGVMILLLKPFRTGDYIAAQGYEGTVKEIQLFNTIIVTSDNKTIIIPNGGLSTGVVNNFTRTGTRRVEWLFNISYGDDYDTAKQLISELLKHDERVLEKPAYFIAMKSLAESSVDIVVRAWVKSGDYWDLYFSMNEKVYKLFPDHGLSIPYNQLDVTLHTADDTVKETKIPTSAAVKKSLKGIEKSEMKSQDSDMKKEDIGIKSTGNPASAASDDDMLDNDDK